MAFLIDSERPTTLDELTYHDSITQQLRGLVTSISIRMDSDGYPGRLDAIALQARRPDLPHLLFYGPTGGGKMTRYYA